MRCTASSLLAIRSRLYAAAALAAAVTSSASADLFATDEPLALTLSAPFGAVFRATTEDPEYQDATLAYRSADGSAASVPLRVRVRGKSRAAVCDFKPLLLNFRTADLVGTAFEGEDRLKLVTHCKASASYDEYLKLEYLSYRVWSLLSETALRARLIEVAYVDSSRARDLGTRPGILLEDEGRFAERQALTVFEGPKVERAKYDAGALALLDVFQYFVGNTDWSALAGPAGQECCHNVVPYVRADGVMVPVPYDFDATGLVNAPHALPDERLPIRSVRQRLYRGACRTPEELAPSFERFQAQRA
ncbi:MAG TPA: hypothetical protein VM692_09650, partial [Gammaproteobacteria bacterium]|nr:hypothetical protein [Gammaproteobacteria bacterium]